MALTSGAESVPRKSVRTMVLRMRVDEGRFFLGPDPGEKGRSKKEPDETQLRHLCPSGQPVQAISRQNGDGPQVKRLAGPPRAC